MARLSVRLLGPFQASLDGQPLSGFRSDKVRALLAFLCVEWERPWPRAGLAELLWSDFPEKNALSNLRNALSNLRGLLDDGQTDAPFLRVSIPCLVRRAFRGCSGRSISTEGISWRASGSTAPPLRNGCSARVRVCGRRQ